MTTIQDRFVLMANMLENQLEKMPNLGLIQGKMGACIFFYKLSRELKESKFEKIADDLVDTIYEDISKGLNPLDFENGLAGIAWGFHYLQEQGFMGGDIDETLADIDDKIFQYITFSDTLGQKGIVELLGYGFYLVKRLENSDEKLHYDKTYFFRRALIRLINKIYAFVDRNMIIFKDPSFFTLRDHLPLCLLFISEAYKLGFYNDKLDRMLILLTPVTISALPYNTGNKLFLLLSLLKIFKLTKDKKWEKHIQIIKDSIDLKYFLKEEVQDRNIRFFYGLSGIIFLLEELNAFNIGDEWASYKEILHNIIVNSEYWNVINSEIINKDLSFITEFPCMGNSLMCNMEYWK